MKRTFPFLFLMIIASACVYGQENKPDNSQKQFLYLLKLEKTMLDSSAWTPEKSKIVQKHFAYLQKLLADGKLILAGRTDVEPEKTFGIVIFEAKDIKEAESIAKNDPGVLGNIMTVEVYPYSVALMKGVKSQ